MRHCVDLVDLEPTAFSVSNSGRNFQFAGPLHSESAAVAVNFIHSHELLAFKRGCDVNVIEPQSTAASIMLPGN